MPLNTISPHRIKNPAHKTTNMLTNMSVSAGPVGDARGACISHIGLIMALAYHLFLEENDYAPHFMKKLSFLLVLDFGCFSI